MTEYYDFMDEEDTDNPVMPAPQLIPKHDWSPVEYVINSVKATWLQGITLSELNAMLEPLHGSVSMDKEKQGPPFLIIQPLPGSEQLSDWDEQARITVDYFFSSRFKEDSELLPKYRRKDILSNIAEIAAGTGLVVIPDDDKLILAGDSGTVDEVITGLRNRIRKSSEVISESRSFPLKHLKYLEKFFTRQLDNLTVSIRSYELDLHSRVLRVEADEEKREVFWKLIADELSNIHEKVIDLNCDMFELLTSKRGAEKIKEIVGMNISQVVYDVVEDPPEYSLVFLSPRTIGKEILINLKKSVSNSFSSVDTVINPLQFRFCSDRMWRELVKQLQEDVFVLITVDSANNSVKVTGENVVVNSVLEKIKLFLSEQVSVEEQLHIDGHKWVVMCKDLLKEIETIQQKAKDVKIQWPQQSSIPHDVTIVIKGDPLEVDRIIGEIKALQNKICLKEEIVRNIPADTKAAERVEKSLKAEVVSIETNFKASIEFSLSNDNSETNLTPSHGAGTVGPPKLCSATCPNEVGISVYSGDFSKHRPVGAIINFVPPGYNSREEKLKLFFAGGIDLQNDFERKISTHNFNPGDLFMSHHGQLQCSKLWHCIVPPWENGKKNEEFYLQDCLSKVLYNTRYCSSILFTSICSKPLKFPAEVFAKSMISMVSSNPNIPSDLTVAVFVDEVADARQFESHFKQNNCRIIQSMASLVLTVAPTATSSPISSYIKVIKGNLLDQKASALLCTLKMTLY